MKSLLLILFTIPFCVVGQSETHNMVTYDTVIPYRCLGSFGGCIVFGHQQYFVCRITRPVNYLSPNNPDTASRPVFVSMQGIGELSQGNYTFINHDGPHYWLANGWDGSVVLGNGTHYPLLITIQPDSAHVRPSLVQQLMDTLIKEFHPRSVHLMGLSMGVEDLGWYLEFQATAGDEHNMANVNSFVDLEGENPAPSTIQGSAVLPYPQTFAYWANKYDGKFFGLEGINDTRNVWQMSEAMDSAVSGSAYFSYQQYGPTGSQGTHCCWDSMYDPRNTNFTNTNPAINWTANSSTHPHTLGTYNYPSSIFQWALRQGDSTLVGSPPPQPPYIPPSYYPKYYISPGEYSKCVLDSTGKPYSQTESINFAGRGSGTFVAGLLDSVNVNGALFRSCAAGLHSTYLIGKDSTLWAYGSNSFGQCGNGVANGTAITVPYKMLRDSLGNAFTGIAGVAPGYAGNVAEYYVAWKYNNDTLWEGGQTFFGVRGDGTTGDSLTVYPTPVVTLPGGRFVQNVVAGQHVIVLATDGTVWSMGNGVAGGGVNNYYDLGTGLTGNSFLTINQVPLPAGSSPIKMIAGGLSFNFLINQGDSLYGFGYWGEYMGCSSGANHFATPTRIDSLITTYLDSTISQIQCTMPCTHVITKKGTLWGWGDNAVGNIGNGQELNFASANPGGGSTPYAWDFGRGELNVQHPIQITPKNNWAYIFGNNNFCLYLDAEDSSNNQYNLYECGRNKGSVLLMKSTGAEANITATYANSWDHPYLTPVNTNGNPFNITNPPWPSTCPGCLTGFLLGSPCTNYFAPSNTPPISKPGTYQMLSAGTTSTVIDGTGSTDNVGIVYYLWTVISTPPGASSPIIEVPASAKTKISGLVNGRYILNLKVTDNGFLNANEYLIVDVGTTKNLPLPFKGAQIIVH